MNSIVAEEEGRYTLAQVATVIEDYFQKPKHESAAESAAKLRKRMEANNAEFKKVVKKLDEVVSQPLLPDPIVIEKKKEDADGVVGMPNEGEVRVIDGKAFLVHRVLEFDSLQGLSLKYNINARALMQCNGLVDDQIFHKREILVPIVDGFVMARQQTSLTEAQQVENIQLKRESAIRMMWEHIEEQMGQGNYKAEALYYCSDNNYEYIKARDAFNRDLEFERQ